MGVTDRFQRAWNAFRNKEPTYPYGYGSGYGRRPDRLILTGGNDRSIITELPLMHQVLELNIVRMTKTAGMKKMWILD